MIDLCKLDKFRLKDKERELYGCTGDSGNGVFKVYVGGKSFRVIASNGMGCEPGADCTRRAAKIRRRRRFTHNRTEEVEAHDY